MQKARRHPIGAPTACRRTVSGTLSLRFPRCFSPFPHGTCALSVSREYLALADGAASFGQGSSGPALLRVRTGFGTVSRMGLSPAVARLPRRVPLQCLLPYRPPYNPARASTPAVWAGPLSLAATRGVTVVLLSSAYLDVSVRRVRLHHRWMPRSRAAGFPIRTPADHGPFAPPRGLSRPSASFFASGSLGIPRAPYGTCRVPRPSAASRRRWFFLCALILLAAARTPRGVRRQAFSLYSSFLPSCQRTGGGLASLSWRARESNP